MDDSKGLNPQALDPSFENEEEQIQAIRAFAEKIDPEKERDTFERIRRLTTHPSPNVRYHARVALDEIRQRSPKPQDFLADDLDAMPAE